MVRHLTPALALLAVTAASPQAAAEAAALDRPAAGAPADEGTAPPATAAEARAILADPSGSLSFGTPGGGELRHAARLPLSGRGWAFLPFIRARGTHFGTDEVAALVPRVAARLQKAFPGAILRLGNVSVDGGGPTRWHASHQVGRDVDVIFLARDRRGRPVTPTAFVRYDEDGRSVAPRGHFTFDVPRNLALVRALVEDPADRVQWIFVADYLEAMLLDEARRTGLPPELVARLEAVLHQPTDSNPHADHFHVRVFCSIQDRLYGCLDYDPERPWVDRGEAPYAARVADLERVLRADAPELREAAARRLGDIRARDAIGALVAHLEDPADAVRATALQTLRRIGDPLAVPGLLGALARADDPRWASRLFAALVAIRSEQVRDVALAFLADPAGMLHPAVAAGPLHDFHRTAARLLGRYGRKAVVPALLALLDSPSARVREAAHDALVSVTNHAVAAHPASTRPRHVAALRDAWRAFWAREADRAWQDWLREGFAAGGYPLAGPLEGPAAIETLIRATGDSRRWLAANAVRLLGDLTGHVVDPWGRGPRGMRRHWERWWELQREAAAAAAAPP